MIRRALAFIARAYWKRESARRWAAYQAYNRQPAGNGWSPSVAAALAKRADIADRAFSFYCYAGGFGA